MNADETQSYIAIRDSNIARNNRFLESLFGVQTLSANEDVPTLHLNESEEVNNSIRNKIISCALFNTPDSINECIQNYPILRTEIQRIHGFLNPNLVRNSPLICAGPMGCGKSMLCRYLLRRVQYYPVVDFKCSGFTTTQQLIVAMWGKVKSTFLHHHSYHQNHQIHSSKRKKYHVFESAISSISCPTNFKSLVISLREIIDTYYCKTEEDSSSRKGKGGVQSTALCIFLDGIDHLASLSGEPSICAKFLALSTQQQISRVKVLATTRAFDLNAISPYGEIVKFSGYSETQLHQILVDMLQVYVSQLQTMSGDESVSSSQSAPAPVPVHLDGVLLSHPILSAYTLVLDAALPTLIQVTRHPRELFQASVSILLYSYSLSLDASTLNSSLWEQRPNGDDIIRCTNNILDRHSFNLLPKDLQPSSSSSSVRKKGQGDTNTIGSSNCSNPEQPIHHDISSSATRSDGKPATTTTASSSATRYLNEPLNIIDRNTLRPMGFSESLPRSMKLLLIAAYLASAHRKEEDLFVLTSAQRGRRKKPRLLGSGLAAASATTGATSSSSTTALLPTDKGDSAGEAGAAGSSSVGASNDGQPTPLVMHSTATNQSFTLERLMGIYSQLALSIDGSIHSQDDGRTTCSHHADIYCQQLLTTSSSGTRSAAATTHNASVGPSPATVGRYYGDTQLYANVATLVSKGILLSHASMNLTKPSFVSTITKSVAQEVAKSLSFNLNEYLTFS